MAKWDKLNSELDAVLNSMTSEDWDSWASEREAKKNMRQFEMMLKRKIKEDSLILSEIKGAQSQVETGISSSNISQPKKAFVEKNELCSADNTSYALAA
ncbi:MAG: hypothetical protein RLZ33_2902 [Bacteroidota bacterium]|jgi:hypothetical protein